MRVLILYGSTKRDIDTMSIHQQIKEITIEKEYEVNEVFIDEKNIKACKGCFCCWFHTPGLCVLKDDGEAIMKSIINSDLVVFITPVVYGTYSSTFKLAYDRLLPLLLPFFKKVKGEFHHKPRYKNYPKIMVVGVMNEENKTYENLFMSLIQRNALNWYHTFKGIVVNSNSGLESVDKLLNQIEVGR